MTDTLNKTLSTGCSPNLDNLYKYNYINHSSITNKIDWVKELNNLKHTPIQNLKGSIMNIKPTIHIGITDNLDPEVNAMVLAMYSRNNEPIINRLPDTAESSLQHKEKLGKFYIGYNHKSIGQCGTTTVFFEGVSQLAAKALENHPLYNGQECSSRYMDFSNQPMYSPDEEIKVWQEKFRAFYIKALPLTVKKIKEEYPYSEKVISIETSNLYNQNVTNVTVNGEVKYAVEIKNDSNELIRYIVKPLNRENIPANHILNECFPNTFLAIDEIKTFEIELANKKDKAIWENTCKARAFDICRGILPAGITTSLAFTGTFDTLNDHLGEMLYHPSKEMRVIAVDTLTKLKQVYPHATKDIDDLKKTFKYVTKEHFYQKAALSGSHSFSTNLQDSDLVKELNLSNRNKFDKVPRYTSLQFRAGFTSALDYGSFRDLQRHRNGYFNMPVLNTDIGYHSFYLNNLPNSCRDELMHLLSDYKHWYNQTSYLSDIDKQYCTPMGFMCCVEYECDINQMLYIMELRSGKTVHQTLRQWVLDWYKLLFDRVGDNIKIHVDTDKDNFTLKRGTQTFINVK